MRFIFKKELYSKTALLKASYFFTDRAYIHLDCTSDEYIVDLEMKNGVSDVSEKEFINEMLCQNLRHEIYKQTKEVRKMLVARSISSSMVQMQPQKPLLDVGNVNEILKDWFESDDKNE